MNNQLTTYLGMAQRPLALLVMFIILNPHALDAFLSDAQRTTLSNIVAVIIAFIGFYKDKSMADAKTVDKVIDVVATVSPVASASAGLSKN